MIFEDSVAAHAEAYAEHTANAVDPDWRQTPVWYYHPEAFDEDWLAELDAAGFVLVPLPEEPKGFWAQAWTRIGDAIWYVKLALYRAQAWWIDARGGA